MIRFEPEEKLEGKQKKIIINSPEMKSPPNLDGKPCLKVRALIFIFQLVSPQS